MSIDLEPRLLDRVRKIVREHAPECEVWVFGSRVSRRSKPFSDLDLAVISPRELSSRQLALLAYAFEDSDLPIKVDIVDWQAAPAPLRERIAERHEVLFRPVTD